MKTKIISLSLILLITSKVIALTPPTGVENTAKAEKLKEKFNAGEFSLSSFAFIENKGQVFGYDGLSHPEVKFIFQQAGTQIFLLERGIAYQFTQMHYPEGYQELMRDKFAAADEFEKIQELQKLIRTETYRMDMTLVGSNQHAKISTEGRSVDYTNFYTRNVLDVHTFSKITYHEIYPGIDWVIYSKNNQIKYDFVVKPGADPSLIKMKFTHQEDLSINKDGSFTLKNRMGSITEKSPESFQNGKKIDTKFVLEGNRVSFMLGNYLPTQTLIIDPAVVWGTYYGGSDSDYGNSCTCDGSGNIYLAGNAASTTSIASTGQQNTYGGGSNDAFLVKFNGSGIRQWGTYYGGNGSENGMSVICDASGNPFLAGITSSSNNIAFSGNQNIYGGGTVDSYLAKFNTSGNIQWATYCGGSNNDYGMTCVTDGSNNVFLVGITSSTNNIAAGGYQNNIGGGDDAFVVKYNNLGILQWGTYYGDTDTDYGNCGAIDASGNIYLAGYTTSTINIATGGHQNTHGGGGTDGFLIKFNNSGVRQWGTYYGGSSFDRGYSCASDISGNIYLAGYTQSNTNISSGGHQNTYGGNQDAFLVKFNGSGVRQWGTYYGGANGEGVVSCSTDGSGNIYLTGATSSTTNIASGGYQNSFAGGNYLDAFLVKLSITGSREWGSYFGGTDNDEGRFCAIDANGNIYLTGVTSSTNNINNGGHQNSLGGGFYGDAFLIKICNNPLQPSSIIGNTVSCYGSAQTYTVINDLAANSYNWGYSGSSTGSSTTNSISIVPLSSGILTVVAQNTCAASLSQTLALTVNPLPTISVNSGSICIGQTFNLNPSGATIYTFSGSTSIVSPTINSTYSVIGTSSAGCISTLAAVSNVTVNPVPIITSNSGSICSGQIFTITPNGANTYSYSGGSNTVSPSINTSYSISGTSSAGCVSTLSAISNVTVFTTPQISVNSGSICEGKSFTISPGGATSYTMTGGSAIVSPNTNSTYSVSGTSNAGCISTLSAVSSVTVNPLPTIVISGTTTSICEGESITLTVLGASTYTWNDGSNGTSLMISPNISTIYTITGSDTNGCENNTSVTQNVDACVGLIQLTKGAFQLLIYPNPNSGEFFIESSQKLNVSIFNALGQLILKETLTEGKNKINLGNQPNGIYFIRIENDLDRIKLIKQ